MIGKESYKEINQLLNKRLEEKKTMIAVHRGVSGGNVVENTVDSLSLTLRMGGDMAECDLSVSTDGVVYLFHDGHEPEYLGMKQNIMTLDSAAIDQLVYLNTLGLPTGRHPQRAEELFSAFQNGELINIDRAWRGGLDKALEVMDKFPHLQYQAVIKTPVKKEYLELLNNHPTKYMYMAIAYSYEEIEEAMSYSDLNLVGVEIIARTNESELFSPKAVEWIHSHGLYVWVNTLSMSNLPQHVCFGDLDDDRAVLQNPDEVWGVLMDRGVDILQTDWPILLKEYRDGWYESSMEGKRK